MAPKTPSRSNSNSGAGMDIPHISPIQYLAINKPAQSRRFVVQFGKTPATSMRDLQMKMTMIVKQFGDEAKRELAKIHPDTGWIMKAMKGANMEGGISDNEFISAHGRNCRCPKCVGLEKHYGFVTNYRSDVDSPLNNNVEDYGGFDNADGARLAKKKSNAGTVVAWTLAVVALGALFIATGERQRSYN